MGLQKIIDTCIWKKAERENTTTFQDVRYNKNHPLYKCVECSGEPYECGDYKGYIQSILKQQNKSTRRLRASFFYVDSSMCKVNYVKWK